MALLLRVKPKFTTLHPPPTFTLQTVGNLSRKSAQLVLHVFTNPTKVLGYTWCGHQWQRRYKLHVCVVVVVAFFFTIIFGHETSRGEGQGRGAPAVSVTCASGVAVLPTFLLQLLQPVMHPVPGGGLRMQNVHDRVRRQESASEGEQKSSKSLISRGRRRGGFSRKQRQCFSSHALF